MQFTCKFTQTPQTLLKYSPFDGMCILHFPVLHFPVLHFPALQMPPSDFWSCIFQSCKFHLVKFGPTFSGPPFSGPAFSAPPRGPCWMSQIKWLTPPPIILLQVGVGHKKIMRIIFFNDRRPTPTWSNMIGGAIRDSGYGLITTLT